MTTKLRLHELPTDLGALQLRWNWIYGPNIYPQKGESEAAAEARIKRDPRMLRQTATIPLRRAGQKIAKAQASTDPLFEVRRIEFKPSPQADAGNVQIVLHIFYRGPVDEKKMMMSANIRHQLFSASNHNYGGGDSYKSATRADNSMRRFVIKEIIDTKYARQQHPHVKKLIWRASISINDAWPREIIVPIDLAVSFDSSQTQH